MAMSEPGGNKKVVATVPKVTKTAANAKGKGKAVPIEAISSDDEPDEVQFVHRSNGNNSRPMGGDDVNAACLAELRECRAQTAAQHDCEEQEVIPDDSLEVSN